MKTQSTSRAAFFNSRLLTGFALCLVGLLLALAGLSKSVTGIIAATSDSNTHHDHHHYQLIDMGTFGGPISAINAPSIEGAALNRRGVTVGWSATSTPYSPTSNPFVCAGGYGNGPPFISLAFRWKNGTLTDLGALPGDNNCSTPVWLNGKGEIVGISENGQIDPLLGFNQSRAVLWKDGEITDLGSLGGNQNAALGINNRGQIIGNSQNTIPDPFCFFGTTQLRAFLWENGVMRDLGSLGGNCVGASYINERSQIAGQSDTTTTPNPLTGVPTVDPFLWEQGTMRDLGTLGGAAGFAGGLNNRGQVIGASSLASDPGACLGIGNTANCHPFLWDQGNLIDLFTSTIGGNPLGAHMINDAGEITGPAAFPNAPFDAYLWRNGVATDLGLLNGDCFSEGWAINSRDQVVGNSYSCSNFHHAFLWENGSIVDLNTLIPGDSRLELVAAFAINARGEIAGMGVPPGVPPGNLYSQGHVFLLIPCDEDHPGIEGCDYSLVDAGAAPSPHPAATKASGPMPPASLWPRNNRFHFPAFGPRN
jgi:probable HAF family extracellular repeat protein